jgi:hypothetical protein
MLAKKTKNNILNVFKKLFKSQELSSLIKILFIGLSGLLLAKFLEVLLPDQTSNVVANIVKYFFFGIAVLSLALESMKQLVIKAISSYSEIKQARRINIAKENKVKKKSNFDQLASKVQNYSSEQTTYAK